MCILIFLVTNAHNSLSAVLWIGITNRAHWFELFTRAFFCPGLCTSTLGRILQAPDQDQTNLSWGLWGVNLVEPQCIGWKSWLYWRLSRFLNQANEGKTCLEEWFRWFFSVKTTWKEKCQICCSQFWRELFFNLGWFVLFCSLII